ncbi:MAG: hypothetical protein HZA53_11050 [Planctomycetes bacterium]|nr:hypothetical protein [Planctomycetota bacterium]
MLLLMVLVLLWRSLDSDIREQGDPHSKVVDPSPVTLLDSGSTELALGARGLPASRSGASTEGTGARSITLIGRTEDETFGVPVAARVEPDRGTTVFSNEVDGGFSLDSTCRNWTVLTVTAPGFQTRRVERSLGTDSGALVISLESTKYTSVRVHREGGEPQQGCGVAWHAAIDKPERGQVRDWVNTSRQLSGRFTNSLTDVDGVSRIPSGHAAYAEISDPRSGTRKTVRVFPGAEALVILPRSALQIQFVDTDSREPVGRMDFDTWFPSEIESMSQRIETDESGNASLWVTSLPVLIRRPGSELWSSMLTPLSPGASSTGMGGRVNTMVRIDELPPTGELVVGVSHCGPQVELLDARTGSAVDGCARLVVRRRGQCSNLGTGVTRCTLRSAHSDFDDPDQRCTVSKGHLRMPCFIPGADSPSAQTGTDLELAILSEGYSPGFFAWPLASPTPDSSALALSLDPCESRTVLTVGSDGRPFRGRVAVYSPVNDVFAWLSPGNVEGRHGPMDWYGGELWVRAGEEREWRLRISAAELSASNTVTISVPTAIGGILIEGVPDGYPVAGLVAKLGVGLEGTIFHPTASTRTTCRFDGIPVGSYTLGPLTWVEGAEQHAIHQQQDFKLLDEGVRVRVRQGETSTIEWLDVWAAGAPMTGQVRVLGTEVRPFLVPQYGPIESNAAERGADAPRMVFGRNSPQLAVDAEGWYRIEATDPIPKLIAVCLPTEGTWGTVQGFQVLETLLPGESVEIPTGTLELTWGSKPTTDVVLVRVEITADALRHPVSTYQSAREFRWQTAKPLMIPCVPLTVRRLVVGRRGQPVRPELGSVTRIAVDIDSLPPIPR